MYIFQYNIQENVWSLFCKLKIRRQNFASAIIEGKIVITGGKDCSFLIPGLKPLTYDYTEVIDLSSKTSRIAGNLNIPRQNHGMSIMKIGKEFKLVAFGGEYDQCLLDSIEIWNTSSETWELSNTLKLRNKSTRFSTATVFNGQFLNSYSFKSPNPSLGT